MKVKVKAIKNFKDLQENKSRIANESIWECSQERANFLLENNAIEIVEEVKKIENVDETIEKIQESAKETVKLEEKPKKKKKTSKK